MNRRGLLDGRGLLGGRGLFCEKALLGGGGFAANLKNIKTHKYFFTYLNIVDLS